MWHRVYTTTASRESNPTFGEPIRDLPTEGASFSFSLCIPWDIQKGKWIFVCRMIFHDASGYFGNQGILQETGDS